MIAKLNIVSTLAALVLFLFPWLDIQCSAKSFATQSGIQTVYGGASPVKDHSSSQAQIRIDLDKKHRKENVDPSYLAGIALLAVIGAVVFAFRNFILGKKPDAVGILCAVAPIPLVIQMIVGFPIRSGLAEAMAQDAGSTRSNDSFEQVGNEMAKVFLEQIQVRYLPVFYLELLALGIPTLVFANSLLDRMKKKDMPDPDVPIY